MNTRKNMTLPVVLVFIFIVIIVYLFSNIKQTTITCEKTRSFDSDIKVEETVVSKIDGKKIIELNVTKVIYLPEKYANDSEKILLIKNSLERTLDYLGDDVTYKYNNNNVVVNINIKNNSELVLLDNISFIDNNGNIEVHINSNTKSNDVIALAVGDSYTEGELMTRLKNNGYYCK